MSPVITVIVTLLVFLTASAHGFDTVVIDAGHGGHDRGGIPGQRYAEKVLALDVAKRVEKELRRAGFKTVMTRSSDRFISLGTRTAIANRYKNAIFVSIHFNSAYRRGARGLETFYYRSDSAGLASRIQNNIMRVARTENRGVKRRGFYVLRKTRVPSVLVECGFLTNPHEARLCASWSYRKKMAKRISRGIMEHYSALRKSYRSRGSIHARR